MMRMWLATLWLLSGGYHQAALAGSLYVSTIGKDDNPGTRTQPFRSIQRGVDAARAGDTVFIMKGVYREIGHGNPFYHNPPRGIVLRHGGLSEQKRLTIRPAPGHDGQVVVDQCAVPQSGKGCPQHTEARSRAGFILGPGTHYVTIEGLEIRNASTAGIWVASSPGDPITRGVVIRNNHIHDIWGNDNTGGIRPDLTDGILIEGNRIHDVVTGGSGTHNASAVHTYLARNGTIRNNELYNARNGVFEKWPDPQKGLNVTANLIYDVNTGIRIGGATGSDVAHDVQISQNVIFNASSCVRTVPELVAPTTGLQVWNNTFADCGVTLDISYFPDTRLWNNILVNAIDSGSNDSTALLRVGSREHVTYSDYNLYYFCPTISASYQPFAIGESRASFFSLGQWQQMGLDVHSLSVDPRFREQNGRNFALGYDSPTKGAGRAGNDIGAPALLP